MRHCFALCVVFFTACATKEADDDATPPEPRTACDAVCDDAHAAACAEKDASFYDHASCIGTCTVIADMKEDTERCYSASQAWFACLAAQADVCLGFELNLEDYTTKACNDEYESYFSCVADYCEDHEQVDYCN